MKLKISCWWQCYCPGHFPSEILWSNYPLLILLLGLQLSFLLRTSVLLCVTLIFSPSDPEKTPRRSTHLCAKSNNHQQKILEYVHQRNKIKMQYKAEIICLFYKTIKEINYILHNLCLLTQPGKPAHRAFSLPPHRGTGKSLPFRKAVGVHRPIHAIWETLNHTTRKEEKRTYCWGFSSAA